MRRAVTVAIIALACGVAACGSGTAATQFCSSGPCPAGPHHWTPGEVEQDVQSNPFPPYTNSRDRLYDTVCHVNAGSTRAACVGRRRFGPTPGERVAVEMLLRDNGTLQLICWPHPSTLCDSIQISDQRADPITD